MDKIDWATFLKNYGILVTAVVGLVGIVLAFVLNRWNSVENRQFSRRAAEHDRKIKEARDVLEKWTSFIYFSIETAKMLSEEKSLQRIARRFASYDEKFKGIPSMRHEAKTKESSIDILEDKELSDLQTELFLKLQIPAKNMITLTGNLRVIEDSLKLGIEKLDIKDITKNVNLDESGEALREANKIITKMKMRLDELAQTVK